MIDMNKIKMLRSNLPMTNLLSSVKITFAILGRNSKDEIGEIGSGQTFEMTEINYENFREEIGDNFNSKLLEYVPGFPVIRFFAPNSSMVDNAASSASIASIFITDNNNEITVNGNYLEGGFLSPLKKEDYLGIGKIILRVKKIQRV